MLAYLGPPSGGCNRPARPSVGKARRAQTLFARARAQPSAEQPTAQQEATLLARAQPSAEQPKAEQAKSGLAPLGQTDLRSCSSPLNTPTGLEAGRLEVLLANRNLPELRSGYPNFVRVFPETFA